MYGFFNFCVGCEVSVGKDKRSNDVEVCLFESYLAKFFMGEPSYSVALFAKIFSAIDNVIRLNQSNKMFDRHLFSTISIMQQEYGTQFDYNDIKQSQHIMLKLSFLKNFSERVLPLAVFKKGGSVRLGAAHNHESPRSSSETVQAIPSLHQLASLSLFKTPSLGKNQLRKYIRDSIIFKPKERGTHCNTRELGQSLTTIFAEKEADADDCSAGDGDNLWTKNFGIVLPEHCPLDLQDYFETAHYSAQFEHSPLETSRVAQWLRSRYLPVVAGASGSAEILLTSLSSLVYLDRKEIQLLFLMLSTSMIALGNHSFFEVMLVANHCGFEIKATQSLLELYLQCIPANIKRSEAFIAFLLSDKGAPLIKGYDFSAEYAAISLK